MWKKIIYYVLAVSLTAVLTFVGTVKYMENRYFDTQTRTYQIFVEAQASGFSGSYQDWLDSIKGHDASAIELRVAGDFVQWKYVNESSSSWRNLIDVTTLMGLPGSDGLDGLPGLTPHVGENGNWWIGTTDTGVLVGAQGDEGITPHIGENGNWWIGLTDTGISASGPQGADGRSAYDIFKTYYPDYQGNESEWMIDLINGNLAVKTFYTVNFDSNGGSPVPSQIIEEGKKALKPITPTKDGYQFDDWYFGDERWVFIGYIVSQDMTLTAQWQESAGAPLLAGVPTIASRDYFRHTTHYTMNPIGEQKMLVIPVMFTDYLLSEYDQTAMRQTLEKAFFGQEEDVAWESIRTYFEKSSYGQLSITGTVTPVYNAGRTTTDFSLETRTSGPYYTSFDATWNLIDEVVPWYKNLSGDDLTEYDYDNDGYIDAIYLIYNNPNASNAEYNTKGESLFWAFQYSNYGALGTSNIASPVGMNYAWSSIDFSQKGYGVNKIDTHTYIHEMGHILGLEDYYSYDASWNDYDALGSLDMQDHNILDHNAYSKYVLGWTKPYIIDETKTTTVIQLRPFESSGDCIMLSSSWNGSPFDEYLMLEFYTPTGLNYMDSITGPYHQRASGFTIPGIKLLHVDSRLGNMSLSTGKLVSYTNTIPAHSYYARIAASNTASRNTDRGVNRGFKHIKLIEATQNSIISGGFPASNSSLFTEGMSFVPEQFSTFFTISGSKFNSGNSIPYEFSVLAITDEVATISITRIS